MATKTLRPLKKGDKCWIRIKREGEPVLAEYIREVCRNLHTVSYNGYVIYCAYYKYFDYYRDDAIFVAKPVPESV